MKTQNQIDKSAGPHDLLVSTATLLGLLVASVIFWIHPLITAGIFATIITLSLATGRHIHAHAAPYHEMSRHVFSQRITET